MHWYGILLVIWLTNITSSVLADTDSRSDNRIIYTSAKTLHDCAIPCPFTKIKARRANILLINDDTISFYTVMNVSKVSAIINR